MRYVDPVTHSNLHSHHHPHPPSLTFPQHPNTLTDVFISVSSAECAEYAKLFTLVRSFAPCDGRKAYFKARVVSQGKLQVATQQMFVRAW